MALSLAVTTLGVAGVVVEADRNTVCADLAGPCLAPLLHRQGSDRQADYRVKPPPSEESVGEQPNKHPCCHVGAKHVLRALSRRRGGPELRTQPRLRPTKERHEHDAPNCQR